MSRISTLFFFVLLLASRSGWAQQHDAALAKLSASPVEKIYLHYDKEYYIAGETIWFKAYLLSNGKPSGLSNNLYLQFMDSKGNIIADNRYAVLGAVAKGSINIPDSLPQGNYYVRALTPGMLNADESFIYKKDIFVFKPSVVKSTATTSQNVNVRFFPESGDLVDGIIIVTGFKATDQWGNPVDVKGSIKTADGTTIAPFSTFHGGIGRVTFKPMAGKKYIAEVETAAGPKTFSLPEVKNAGINLKIQDERDGTIHGKKFQLNRGPKDKDLFDNLKLVVQLNNQVVFENEITFEGYPSVIGHLVTDSLPSGILHFTVFSKEGVPLAERLSFIDNGEYKTAATLLTPKVSVEKRSLNEFEISFNEGVPRSCSVSITDLPSFSFNDEDNIYSHFLLTSDLKGYIYNPAWYFERSGDSATQLALDNLMITHGWSRFNWSEILSGKFPASTYKDEPFISIAGVVKDEKNTISPNGKINFFIEAADSSETTYEIPVNAKGEFRMDSLIFNGPSKFFYAYSDAKGKARPGVTITITTTTNPNPMVMIPANTMENVIQRNTAVAPSKGEVDARNNYVQSKFNEMKELEKVTLTAKSTKKPIEAVNEKYTTGVFRSPGKENIDNINEPSNDKSLSVVDYIKNNIQQIEIQGGQLVNRKNFSLMTGQKWAVGVFLNESPTGIGELMQIRMQDVALIKFYEAGFVGVGSSFPGGAVAVYTKEKFKEEEKPAKLNFFAYNGYTLTKEFYNPDYLDPGFKAPVADNRTTLYWSGDAITDAESKTIRFRFFNNDFSKKFKVVVEGFDANGKLIHLEKIVSN